METKTGLLFENPVQNQTIHWGTEPICQRAFSGCSKALDYDEFFYRCSDRLLASICLSEEYKIERGQE